MQVKSIRSKPTFQTHYLPKNFQLPPIPSLEILPIDKNTFKPFKLIFSLSRIISSFPPFNFVLIFFIFFHGLRVDNERVIQFTILGLCLCLSTSDFMSYQIFEISTMPNCPKYTCKCITSRCGCLSTQKIFFCSFR